MVQKYQHQQKYVVLVKCVEDVVRKKEYSYGAELNRLLIKFYAALKNKCHLLALPPRHFFHVYISNK